MNVFLISLNLFIKILPFVEIVYYELQLLCVFCDSECVFRLHITQLTAENQTLDLALCHKYHIFCALWTLLFESQPNKIPNNLDNRNQNLFCFISSALSSKQMDLWIF